MFISLLLLIGLHPNAWKISQNSYQSDSLFVLSSIEIVGLVILTSIMAITLFLVNFCKTRRLYRCVEKTNKPKNTAYWLIPLDITLSILLFFLFWAIAPQIHYFYYQQIMDGLQNQWVIGGGMRAERAIRFFILSAENSIADHANGLALWLCILTSSFYPIMKFKSSWVGVLFGLAFIVFALRLLQILTT